MTNLIPRPGSAFTSNRPPEGFTRMESRALAQRQNAVVADALVTATRLQAKSMVTAAGIQLTGLLSREAEFQSRGNPQLLARTNYLVDVFTEYAGTEISGFRCA